MRRQLRGPHPARGVVRRAIISLVPRLVVGRRGTVVGGVATVFAVQKNCGLRGRLKVSLSQASEHEAGGSDEDHGFTVIGAELIVFGHAAELGKPAEGAFEKPANGYFLRDLLIFNGLNAGGFASKGFIFEPTSAHPCRRSSSPPRRGRSSSGPSRCPAPPAACSATQSLLRRIRHSMQDREPASRLRALLRCATRWPRE